MFKNMFDSFFIIDAKDKPAPSFLTAYIFTWVFFNYQMPFTFIKTTGDLTTRFNASLNVQIEYQWYLIVFFTLGVVLSRFVLNNVIYSLRESIDTFTQGWLKHFNVKSFKSDKEYQNLEVQKRALQSQLSTARDAEHSARESEQKVKDERNTLKNELAEITAEHTARVNEVEECREIIDSQIAKVNELELKIEDHNNEVSEYLRIQGELEENITSVSYQLNLMRSRLNEWSKITGNEDILAIGYPKAGHSEQQESALNRILNSKVVYHDFGSEVADMTSQTGNIFGAITAQTGQGLVSRIESKPNEENDKLKEDINRLFNKK